MLGYLRTSEARHGPRHGLVERKLRFCLLSSYRLRSGKRVKLSGVRRYKPLIDREMPMFGVASGHSYGFRLAWKDQMFKLPFIVCIPCLS